MKNGGTISYQICGISNLTAFFYGGQRSSASSKARQEGIQLHNKAVQSYAKPDLSSSSLNVNSSYRQSGTAQSSRLEEAEENFEIWCTVIKVYCK